jgi:hypothetical protein
VKYTQTIDVRIRVFNVKSRTLFITYVKFNHWLLKFEVVNYIGPFVLFFFLEYLETKSFI